MVMVLSFFVVLWVRDALVCLNTMNRSIRECNQLNKNRFFVKLQYLENHIATMEGLSERAYATHSGLSRGAVQKARKNGRLVLFGDRSINAAASDARRGAMTDPD
jgi:hypothetical protein